MEFWLAFERKVERKRTKDKVQYWIDLNWTGVFRLNWIEDWTVPIELNSIEPFAAFEVWQPFSRAFTLLESRRKFSRAPPAPVFLSPLWRIFLWPYNCKLDKLKKQLQAQLNLFLTTKAPFVDSVDVDCAVHWQTKLRTANELADVALLFYAAPTSEAAVERTISVQKFVMTPIRNRMADPVQRLVRGRFESRLNFFGSRWNFYSPSNFLIEIFGSNRTFSSQKKISKKIPLAPGYFSLEPDRTFCTIESNRGRTCSDRGRTFSDRGRTFRNVLILGDFEPFFWVKLGSFWGHFIIVLHRFGVVLFNALAFLEREKARSQRQFAIAFIFSMPQYVAARRSKAPPQPQLNFTQANSNAGVSDKALRRGAKTASWPFAIVCFQKPAKCFSHANYHIQPLQKSVWNSNSECFQTVKSDSVVCLCWVPKLTKPPGFRCEFIPKKLTLKV